MINLDKVLLKEIEESSCFGIAYDSIVPECKQCDLSAQCESKSRDRAEGRSLPAQEVVDKAPEKKNKAPGKPKENIKKKESPKTTPKKKSETKPKPKVVKKTEEPLGKIDGEMPEFKGMPMEEVVSIAKANNVEWKDYGNENITRMRLVMTLKKMYS